MKKTILAFAILTLIPKLTFCQELEYIKNSKSYPAHWISHPEASGKAYGVFHFRKSPNFSELPDSLIIHVSADNRYRLYINGLSICFGPARGNLKNWYFETVDIAKYLKKGKNTIAAEVWNMGEYTPVAQHSAKTGFLLWTENQKYHKINSNSSWKVLKNEAYLPVNVNVRGYYAAGACDRVNGNKFPWNWQNADFDDSSWKNAKKIEDAQKKGYLYGCTWQLIPRMIPLMEEKPEKPLVVRKSENIKIPVGKYDFKKPIVIPANQKASILFDQQYLTTGYPELTVSKGTGAKIRTTYAESGFINALQSPWNEKFEKKDRNEIEGRYFDGTYDVFIADGGTKRHYSPLWMRCWRYIKMDIETGDEELVINNYSGVFSAYPFKQKAIFKTNNPELEKIWNVSWRTARLCAGETYFDCPYYEQLQYVGDTRIQALISLYVTGDDRLMKQAIAQLDYSRFNEGLTFSRYPSEVQQVIPPFSLYWIDMIYDHWMHKADTAFIRQFLPGIETVVDWFQCHISENALPGKFNDWWFFADWADQFESGIPKGAYSGYSSVISLHFAYTLEHAAAIMAVCGKRETSEWYAQLASTIKQAVMKHCYHKQKGLIAQTPEKTQFSQHSNIMGILTNTFEDSLQPVIMKNMLLDSSLVQATIYYKFYLFQAMQKTGFANQYLDQLGDWHFMLEQNLTTFAEVKEKTRSDCHAWSASPLYHFLATVCGIRPLEPGFKTIAIAPAPGKLDKIEAAMPLPQGNLEMIIKRKGKFGLSGKLVVPANSKAIVYWNGKKAEFDAGNHKVFLK